MLPLSSATCLAESLELSQGGKITIQISVQKLKIIRDVVTHHLGLTSDLAMKRLVAGSVFADLFRVFECELMTEGESWLLQWNLSLHLWLPGSEVRPLT